MLPGGDEEPADILRLVDLIRGADIAELQRWMFVVHPIFSEFLRLDTRGSDLTLRMTWDYLQVGDAMLAANPFL